MKPRPLINLAAAVSLLLAVAIIALWVRSYDRRERLARTWSASSEEHTWEIESGYSSLSLYLRREVGTARPIAPSYHYRELNVIDSLNPFSRRWFFLPPVQFRHWYPPADPYDLDLKVFTVAYWLLLPPTLILPMIAFTRHRRRRKREMNNLCPTCGYDRRAHNARDRCPECGISPTGSA